MQTQVGMTKTEQDDAQYKAATTNTQRSHETVLMEAQDHIVQLGMRIRKLESVEIPPDYVDQLGVRVQALENMAKRKEGPSTSLAPAPPEGFDPNAVAQLARELGQVKSYFKGQIRTLGQNMDALMNQLQEEHLPSMRGNPMDRGYYPRRAEPAPRGPFWGYVPEPSRVPKIGPSNPFMHPQRDWHGGPHYETHRCERIGSDHRVPTHDGMPPRGN